MVKTVVGTFDSISEASAAARDVRAKPGRGSKGARVTKQARPAPSLNESLKDPSTSGGSGS